jgi:hypothetical protein
VTRRESKIIAVAGGLNAQGLDLTKYRQRWIGDKRPHLSAQEADGALGFATGAVLIKDADDPEGQWYKGDEFRSLLLRIKMGQQLSVDPFKRALLLLLKRQGEEGACATTQAVAAGALFEWLNDQCMRCRGAKHGQSRPKPCTSCFPVDKEGDPVPRRDVVELFSHAKRRIIACFAAVPGARNGCMKCAGSGRIFTETRRRSTVVRCRACSNTGRIEFEATQRWRFVDDYLRMRGGKYGISRRAFLKGWMSRYESFLKALRSQERKLGVGLDLGLNADRIARSESVPDGD